MIHYSQLPGIVIAMDAAHRNDQVFVGFDSKIQMLSDRDLHFFGNQAEAFDFRDVTHRKNKDVTLLPLLTTIDFIGECVQNGFQNGQTQPNVLLDMRTIMDRYEDYKFNLAAVRLSEAMDGFDWKVVFYDPLEANTEAESFEDKIAFNRLEHLVEELTAFAQSGDAAKEFVSALITKHWKDQPMESQIESVLTPPAKLNELLPVQGDMHAFSLELMNEVKKALSHGNSWMAYNEFEYLLDKTNCFFFKNDDQAFEFSQNNISDRDSFRVIQLTSPEDLLLKVPYDTNQLISSTKNNVMNMENKQFIKDLVKGKGFGEELWPLIEQNIQEGKQAFSLPYKTEINNLKYEANLHFKKGSSGDMYFFNGYDATLTRSNGQEMKQTFEIKKGLGMTKKESYNQLQGRAVLKKIKGEGENAEMEWSRLNLSKKKDNGQYPVETWPGEKYDLKAAINKFAVLEMDGGDLEKDLLKSIERGNAQSATMDTGGEPLKVFLEANPEYKTINVYDNHFNLLKHDDLPKRVQNDVKQQVDGQPKKAQTQAQKNGNRQNNGQRQGRGVRASQ